MIRYLTLRTMITKMMELLGEEEPRVKTRACFLLLIRMSRYSLGKFRK